MGCGKWIRKCCVIPEGKKDSEIKKYRSDVVHFKTVSMKYNNDVVAQLYYLYFVSLFSILKINMYK